ncbi:DNA pilot protein VP2 [Microviridae Bog5275_51]|uniref:DNA pilot protein VP2 n=1 Tax=Microviridae Bog5275_51 TaxID=1655648 RepID=UPI00063D53BA|nr:DNA pilot protein VP2 [Microviridae Bog5275_51]AKI26881.1 DNA pilot protein VP2 [Microviridae Bog5275_51]
MNPTTASLISGAIPVVGGIVSGLINNANVNATNAANRQFQLQQQQMQNEFNVQMWDAQNAYNSPSAAMARFQAAGLNPNLIYGAGASGATFAGTAPRAATIDYVQAPHQPINGAEIGMDALNAYNSNRVTTAQVTNLGADTQLKQASVPMIQADVENTQTNTAKTAAEIPFIAPTANANIALTNSETDKANADAAATNLLAPLQAGQISADIGKTFTDTNAVAASIARDNAVANATVKSLVAQTALDYMNQSKSAAEIAEIKANASVALQQLQTDQFNFGRMQLGINPTDGAPYRAAQTILNWIFAPDASGLPSTTVGKLGGTLANGLKMILVH